MWGPSDIEGALRDIASFHAAFLDRTDALVGPLHLDPTTRARALRLAPLWDAILAHNRTEMPAIFTPSRVEKLRGVLGSVGTLWARLEEAPRTVVHGDFNLRNVCLRRSPEPRLCAYDWELATVHAPQRDVCEFLAYALRPGEPGAVRQGYVDFYRGEARARLAQGLPCERLHGRLRAGLARLCALAARSGVRRPRLQVVRLPSARAREPLRVPRHPRPDGGPDMTTAREEVRERIVRLLGKHFAIDPGAVKDGSTFRGSLGMDSADVIDFVALLEREFGLDGSRGTTSSTR